MLGSTKEIMKNRGIRIKVKWVLFEKILLPSVTCGSKVWGKKRQREKMNMLEMKYYDSMAN